MRGKTDFSHFTKAQPGSCWSFRLFKWQKAVCKGSQLSLCCLLLACVPQPQPVPVVSASASLAPTVSPPAPTPKASTFQTPAPAPTSTVPSGAIRVSSEITGGYLFCQKQELPEKVVLRYPTDLAVMPDGKTVYAIDTLCADDIHTKLGWGFFFLLYPGIFPENCTHTGFPEVQSRHYIYALKQNQPAEILLIDGKPPSSCSLGLDLESDSEGNLYFTDRLDQQVIRYGSDGVKALFHTYEKSGVNAGCTDCRETSYFGYFDYPYDMKVAEQELFFSMYSYKDMNSTYLLRKANTKSLKQENIAYGQNSLYGKLVSRKGILYDFKGQSLKGTLAALFRESKLPFDRSGSSGVRIPLSWPDGTNPDSDRVISDLVSTSNGKFYFSDIKNHQIWSITLNNTETQGVLNLVAGSGSSGYEDGDRTHASFSIPTSLSVDAAGNLYVADTGNSAIRKITPDGVVTTFYKAP